jgi:DNA mismatch endonuclease, patch repair protein
MASRDIQIALDSDIDLFRRPLTCEAGTNMDTVSGETRSRMMTAVRSKNTAVEFSIRRRLFALRFRYRLHVRELPGTPDMVFPMYHAVVFVNGCFWHNHGCQFSALPETRRAWWKEKLEGNRKRDAAVLSTLSELGWRTLVIWECSFRVRAADRNNALKRVVRRTVRFLHSRQRAVEIPPVGTLGDSKNAK